MNYWLFKSEPTCFSIDDLAECKNQTEHWDGVRNYQARNMMRDDMKQGDLGFFYHSSCKVPGIVGVVEIVKEAYPDFTAFDPNQDHYDPKSTDENPRWFMVDVKLKQKFNRVIELSELKELPTLEGLQLLRKGNRLSVMPVAKDHFDTIMKLSD